MQHIRCLCERGILILDKVDQVATAKGLMLSQFNNSPDLTSLVESFITPIENLERDIEGLLESNTVPTAEGNVLDVLGSWVGVDRGLKTTEEYRQAILGKALTETSDGSTKKVYNGLEALSQTEKVTFYEAPEPPTVYAHLGDGWNNESVEQVKSIKMAGVNYLLLVDHNLDSLFLAELVGEGTSVLETFDGDDYVVTRDGIDYNLLVRKAANSTYFGGTLLAEENYPDVGTPLVDVIDRQYKVVGGMLTNQDGDLITTEDGTPFTYRGLEV